MHIFTKSSMKTWICLIYRGTVLYLPVCHQGTCYCCILGSNGLSIDTRDEENWRQLKIKVVSPNITLKSLVPHERVVYMGLVRCSQLQLFILYSLFSIYWFLSMFSYHLDTGIKVCALNEFHWKWKMKGHVLLWSLIFYWSPKEMGVRVVKENERISCYLL